MNQNHAPLDSLARLRAERAAEHAALVQHMADRLQRCAIARAFGYRLAVERLTWAEIKHHRAQIQTARYSPEYAYAHPREPRAVGKDDMTMQVQSTPEWAAFLEGIDLAAQAAEAQG